MIRVLHFIGGLNRGGAETMVMNLYRSIDRSRVQFDFIVSHPEEQDYSEEIRSLGGKIYEMPNFNGVNYFSLRRKWRNFFREHPEYRILHSHVRSYASIYIPVAKKCGVKTIVHSHSTSNGSGIKSVVKKILQYPLRYQADYLFACSNEAGEWLYGKKATKGDRYKIIPNAVDLDKFRFDPQVRDEYRAMLGIGDRMVYANVGRLHPAKNHPFLLDVFAEIRKKNDRAVLLLVGDGELRAEVEDKIEKLQLQDSVMMLGSRDDVHKILQAADCFLFPSRWEGLPVTVIEAQVAGLPCLVSDRITGEVLISDYVHPLPIDRGTECWVDTAEQLDYRRHDFRKEVGETKFDITTSAAWLTDFYVDLDRN